LCRLASRFFVLLLVEWGAGSEQNASECGKSGEKTKVHGGEEERMVGVKKRGEASGGMMVFLSFPSSKVIIVDRNDP
jgi:hypothetical protein